MQSMRKNRDLKGAVFFLRKRSVRHVWPEDGIKDSVGNLFYAFFVLVAGYCTFFLHFKEDFFCLNVLCSSRTVMPGVLSGLPSSS